jgi:hypothetical protein
MRAAFLLAITVFSFSPSTLPVRSNIVWCSPAGPCPVPVPCAPSPNVVWCSPAGPCPVPCVK